MEITYNGGRARRSLCSASHPHHSQELTHQASERRNLDTIQFLFAHGVSVNDGDTPVVHGTEIPSV